MPWRGPQLRTDLAVSSQMPRDFHQGLFFMLGFLLAFYILLPLIGVKV
jgi:hypothetical protein